MEEDCGELLKWATSIGITDAPLDAALPSGLGYTLRIASFPDEGGRGLAATRHIKEGELILRVPHAALIGVHSARGDPQFGKTLQGFPHLSSVQVLTVYLLSELAKARASRWFPYFQHLPRVHHTLAHFSQFVTEALQAEDAIWTAKLSSEKAQREWKEANPLLLKLGLRRRFTTFKAWLWASATIASRTLHVPWDEAGVLCPIGDLFNYEPPGQPYTGSTLYDVQLLSDDFHGLEIEQTFSEHVNIEEKHEDIREDSKRLSDGCYESSTSSYCFYARRSYNKGQQVLLCYGQYTNLELLEHYGFLLLNNPNDVVYVALPDSDEFGFDSSAECERQHAGCYTEICGKPSFSLLGGLRLRANPVPVRRSLGYLAVQGLPISEGSDASVYQWLVRKCESTLRGFSTTITEDVTILSLLDRCEDFSSSTSFLNQHSGLSNGVITQLETIFKAPEEVSIDMVRLSIQWRLAYKMILQRCVSYSQVKARSCATYEGRS